MEAIPSNMRSDRRKKKDDDDDEFKVLIINVSDGSRPPTDSTQERRDGVPDADAAHAEPLTDGQLQVEQREALEHQRYQVGDEESP